MIEDRSKAVHDNLVRQGIPNTAHNRMAESMRIELEKAGVKDPHRLIQWEGVGD